MPVNLLHHTLAGQTVPHGGKIEPDTGHPPVAFFLIECGDLASGRQLPLTLLSEIIEIEVRRELGNLGIIPRIYFHCQFASFGVKSEDIKDIERISVSGSKCSRLLFLHSLQRQLEWLRLGKIA
ncbi:hypothetical protein D3C85_1458610 [compost metagenome]